MPLVYLPNPNPEAADLVPFEVPEGYALVPLTGIVSCHGRVSVSGRYAGDGGVSRYSHNKARFEAARAAAEHADVSIAEISKEDRIEFRAFLRTIVGKIYVPRPSRNPVQVLQVGRAPDAAQRAAAEED